ncbi:MAG: hypothetical protein KC609_08020 [Myxococcales bacterium]|nr:hypothetical protein [Myxococcales bacterium]
MGSQELTTVAPDTLPLTVTWSTHIQPLMQFYCTSCHFTNETKNRNGDCDDHDMNLNDYDTVVNCYPDLYESIAIKQDMPPGGARRMTARHKALLKAWLDGGFAK